MAAALLRYRIMAWVTGCFLGALTIWLVIGYGFLDYAGLEQKPEIYRLMWTGHGWFYFIYLITGVDLTFRMRWSLWSTPGILIAGTIPFASFFAERWVTKRVRASMASAEAAAHAAQPAAVET